MLKIFAWNINCIKNQYSLTGAARMENYKVKPYKGHQKSRDVITFKKTESVTIINSIAGQQHCYCLPVHSFIVRNIFSIIAC
jgi:hypothetical protein